RARIRRHLPECPTVRAVIRVVELHVIERVEELRAELQRLALGEPEILHDGKVPVVDARPAQHITSHVAVAEHRHASWNRVRAARVVHRANQVRWIKIEIAGYGLRACYRIYVGRDAAKV